MRQSGIGRTRGIDGLRQFTELKHVNWEVGAP
jgi:acyl-CoA reductase-like NAD-dependent aldehyde dehydrogenase